MEFSILPHYSSNNGTNRIGVLNSSLIGSVRVVMIYSVQNQPFYIYFVIKLNLGEFFSLLNILHVSAKLYKTQTNKNHTRTTQLLMDDGGRWGNVPEKELKIFRCVCVKLVLWNILMRLNISVACVGGVPDVVSDRWF